MSNIKERKKALEAILEQKIPLLQQIETQRNNLVTEIVQIQGKIELLVELEHESSNESSEKEEEKE